MSNGKSRASVRVCAISDVECSRGCGTGACKREQHSENCRANALTDDDFLALWKRANGARPSTGNFERMVIDYSRALLAASPIEQPAAAPINQCDGCRVNAPLTEQGNHAMPDGGFMGCTKGRYTPSLADERAAFEAWAIAEGFDVKRGVHRDNYAGAITESVWAAWQARAAASNETGEEGAKPVAWLIDWPDEPELGHYFAEEPCDPMYGRSRALGFMASRSPAIAAEAVAFEITEQAAAEWASRHDVDHVLKHFSTQRNAIEDARTLHLLAAAPQPAQADAGEIAELQAEIERLTAIINAPRAEVTVEQPSLTNPLTPFGMLVRSLRIVAQTNLFEMAQCLAMTPAQLSAIEFGRTSVTPEIVREVAMYFDSLGVSNTRPALDAAIDAARAGGAE